MNKTARLTEQEQAALQQEQQKHRRGVRQQLIGAAVIFAVTFLLWKVGGVSPPSSPLLHDVPPLQQAFPQEEEALTPDKAVFMRADEETVELEEPEDAVMTETAAPLTAALAPAEETGGQNNQSPPDEEEPAQNAQAQASYVVQVGAFSQPQWMQAAVDKLEQNGFKVRRQLTHRDNQQLWRVQVVEYPTHAAAERGQQALAELGYTQTRILALTDAETADNKVEAAAREE